MNPDKIVKPALIVDLDKVRANIARMAEKAKTNGCVFRPHFKTHQSAQIAELFKEYYIDKITVTSVEMAEYFVKHGWTDITIAMPVNIREMQRINNLASKITLNLIIDSEFTAKHLAINLSSHVNIWIEIDNGYHRSGISYEDISSINKIVNTLVNSEYITFVGFISHFGNTYSQGSINDINITYTNSINRLKQTMQNIVSIDNKKLMISVGDTPSCSVVEIFGDVNEIRPGNFVFYDLMQLNLGVCAESDIAVVMACPVISKNESRQEIVLYAGAIHLSKESIVYQGNKVFGAIVRINEKGWSNIVEHVFIRSLSQEHAIIKASDEFFDKVNIGDLLGVVPVHSCLTANLMGSYITTDGDIVKMARFR